MTVIDKKVQANLPEKDIDMLKVMENNLGKRKAILVLTKLMPGIYNKLCKDCKAKVFSNPKINIQLYCDMCQDMIKNKLEKYVK